MITALTMRFEKSSEVEKEAIRRSLDQGKLHLITIALTELGKFKLEEYL
jgi:hypothetical protein